MENINYKCPKCGNTAYKLDEMRATGSKFSRFYDPQKDKLTMVTCARCTYTEFYKAKINALSNIFDLFTN